MALTIRAGGLFGVVIIGLVLLQRGKGADAGAGFGAGASGTVFGARGARTALSRATAIFAALFMLNSLALAYMGTRRVGAAEDDFRSAECAGCADDCDATARCRTPGQPSTPAAIARAGARTRGQRCARLTNKLNEYIDTPTWWNW